MRLLAIVVLLLSFSLYAAVKSDTPGDTVTQAKPIMHVTEDKPEFTIELKANPTTGYSWFLRDYNAELVQPVSHQYLAPENKKLMGAPGKDVWKFKMKPAAFTVPHQTVIRFVYARPWEVNENSTQLAFKITTA